MAKPARPTKRCLAEDLSGEGWDDAAERRAAIDDKTLPALPLHELRHSLISHAAGQFPGGDADINADRESISGLANPMWWKVKTGRWRGAVYVDANEQAWLCAAGLRREDERDDFYANFSTKIDSRGADEFLPTKDDKQRLDDETAFVNLVAAKGKVIEWEHDVAVAAINAVAEAIDQGMAVTTIPSLKAEESLAELAVAVERTGEESPPAEAGDHLAEVQVEFIIRDWSNTEEHRRARVIICAIIAPSEDAWDVLPDTDVDLHVATTTEARIQQIAAAVDLGNDAPAAFDDIDNVAPVAEAHFAYKDHIVHATVHGKAVVGLCGKWFVPRRDPDNMRVCDECKGVFDHLREQREEDTAD